MTDILTDRCRAWLTELDLIAGAEVPQARALTGGVASDIAVVKTRTHSYCVKFARPKRKVDADWFAPVNRNVAEQAWLAFAAHAAPDCAVRMFGRSESAHGFAMAYLSGEDVELLESALFAEAPAGALTNLSGPINDALSGLDAADQMAADGTILALEPSATLTGLLEGGREPTE